jgi:hypothetical protein
MATLPGAFAPSPPAAVVAGGVPERNFFVAR